MSALKSQQAHSRHVTWCVMNLGIAPYIKEFMRKGKITVHFQQLKHGNIFSI